MTSGNVQAHPAVSYRADIDGLRAIAVIAVIGFHGAAARVPGGFVGVDVFFVISGFLISSIIIRGLDQNNLSLAEFYARRVRRIFPALAVVLLTTLALGWFFFEPREYAALGKHVVAAGVFVSNVVLWRESGYFDTDSALKPLLHLWSLGVEEQFYLLWPLLLVATRRVTQKIWPTVAIICVVSFGFNLWQVRTDPSGAFYLPFSRFWELLAGAALACLKLRRTTWLDGMLSSESAATLVLRVREVMAFAGLVLIGTACLVFGADDAFPAWRALVPVSGAALVIAAGDRAWVNRVLLSHKALVAVGVISYPLYLWHWPLLVFARSTSAFSAAPRLTVLAAIAVAFACSVLTYRMLEIPVRRNFRRARSGLVVQLSSAITAIVAMGLVVSVSGGLSMRYPRAVRPLLEYQFDHGDSYWNTRCLLENGSQRFPAECTQNLEGFLPAQRMIVWGDSHATMLYRSLVQISGIHGGKVGELTSGNCAPVMIFDRHAHPWCLEQSREARERINQLRPATVVLAAAWMADVERSSLDQIPETVRWLRGIGVKRIILVGPEPDWHEPFPTEIARFMREQSLMTIPSRLRYGLSPAMAVVDAHAALIASASGIEYVSPFNVFCNTDGCLTMVQGQNLTLTAWDNSHLTPEAADYLVNTAQRHFFSAVP